MRKVVIVDDENDIREVLRHSIELKKDWIVLEAPNGAAGLELVRQEMPDVVLLDVMMPRMDGREVFRILQQDPKTSVIPVIFITASLQKEDVRALEALGPRAVLAKPFDPLVIADKIADLLGW